MSYVTIISVVASATASFFLGHISVRVLREKYLDGKRDELMKFKGGLDAISDSLDLREEALRHKWQMMISDASELNALVNGGSDTWTSADKRFLESWSSAERISRTEN